MLKDTDASITADLSLTSGNMPSLSGQEIRSLSEDPNTDTLDEALNTEPGEDLTETENSTISTVTETAEKNRNLQPYSTINQKEIEMIIESKIDEKLTQKMDTRKFENFEKNLTEKFEKMEKSQENLRKQDDYEGTFKLIKERINRKC